MTAVLTAITRGMIYLLFRLAAARRTLHRGFADKAARVEGEYRQECDRQHALGPHLWRCPAASTSGSTRHSGKR